MTNAQDAINTSMQRTDIVTLDWDAEAFAELHSKADDTTRGNEAWEFSAVDPDDENEMTWRVHMRFAGDDEFRALRVEAAQFGDGDQVGLCERALDGDSHAARLCQDVTDATARNLATI